MQSPSTTTLNTIRAKKLISLIFGMALLMMTLMLFAEYFQLVKFQLSIQLCFALITVCFIDELLNIEAVSIKSILKDIANDTLRKLKIDLKENVLLYVVLISVVLLAYIHIVDIEDGENLSLVNFKYLFALMASVVTLNLLAFEKVTKSYLKKYFNLEPSAIFSIFIATNLAILLFYVSSDSSTLLKSVTGLMENKTPSAQTFTFILEVTRQLSEFFISGYGIIMFVIFAISIFSIKNAELIKPLLFSSLALTFFFMYMINDVFTEQNSRKLITDAIIEHDMIKTHICTISKLKNNKVLYLDGGYKEALTHLTRKEAQKLANDIEVKELKPVNETLANEGIGLYIVPCRK